MLLGLTILEHHTGCLQRGGNLRWSLIDARTDPTADLYGWDEVAGRLDQLGVLDDPEHLPCHQSLVSECAARSRDQAEAPGPLLQH